MRLPLCLTTPAPVRYPPTCAGATSRHLYSAAARRLPLSLSASHPLPPFATRACRRNRQAAVHPHSQEAASLPLCLTAPAPLQYHVRRRNKQAASEAMAAMGGTSTSASAPQLAPLDEEMLQLAAAGGDPLLQVGVFQEFALSGCWCTYKR